MATAFVNGRSCRLRFAAGPAAIAHSVAESLATSRIRLVFPQIRLYELRRITKRSRGIRPG